MAGAGYKLFNTGDVLTAAQVNTYLQEQTVMVFANATARTTALSGVLAEGMMSYLQDTNAVEVYDGSAWVSVGSTGDITGVTAGTGISGGGTSGTVTITNSMATAIDAKGDLIVGTGADTFARLAVGGTNGHVLTVDSGEATGMKWAAAAGGASFSGASVYKNNTAQSVANATTVAATFDTEAFDTDSYHSTSSNTSRFTIPSGKDGKYLLLGRVTYVANSSGVRQGRLLKNGNLIAVNTDTTPGSGGGQNIEVSGIYSAVAGDYFEVAYWQNSGGSLNSEAGGEFYDAFFIQYLGA